MRNKKCTKFEQTSRVYFFTCHNETVYIFLFQSFFKSLCFYAVGLNARVFSIVSGPIAPIFLPGAWRRAKAKLEEVEKMEAATNVVEVQDDSRTFQTSDLLKQDDNNPSIVKPSDLSVPNNNSAIGMPTFFSMFEKAVPKPVAVVVQLIEAPFPKVSHVQQQNDDMKDTKWKLPMIRSRFVKEEYFFEPRKFEPSILTLGVYFYAVA